MDLSSKIELDCYVFKYYILAVLKFISLSLVKAKHIIKSEILKYNIFALLEIFDLALRI